MFKRITIFFLSLLLLTGCMSQEDRDCDRLVRLEFSHTLNKQFEDRLNGEVLGARVYVFNADTDLLQAIIPIPEAAFNRGYYDIGVPQNGNYTFVAWGSSHPDMTQSGFFTVNMENSSAHDYNEEIRIGVTTLEKMRMILDYVEVATPRSTADRVQLAPSNGSFEHLFYGANKAMWIDENNNQRQSVSIDFMRNTSTLNLEVNGIQHLAHGVEIFVTGNNGRYNFDNSICPDAREVLYQQEPHFLSATQMLTDIRMNRFVVSRHLTEQPILLHVRCSVTDAPLVAPLNVVQAIRSVRDENNLLVWQTQEDFDRESEFPIQITFGSGSNDNRLNVTIAINDWIVMELAPGLSRT